MARLIDANALKANFVILGKFENDLWHVGSIRRAIDNAPTIEARPVVHGRWLWHDDEFEYVCSACKCRFDYNHTFGIFDHGYEYGNYCPNCGAHMDGGADNG